MKVQTERLPKSLIALEIEPDAQQVERELERAARRLAQKVTIPGFRKGKAPRFIVENYFGREAILEEATDELINTAFKAALEQQGIEPIGQAKLERVEQEPFSFRVVVPVDPTIKLGDYRSIRLGLEIDKIGDEDVQRALESMRDQHAVVQDLTEERGARAGDQLTLVMETYIDGELQEEREEGQAPEENTLVLDEKRLLPELYEGLQGVTAGESREIVAQLPDDHPNEKIAGKQVTFKTEVRGVQERLLPEWEELPTLSEFEGDLEALRADVRRRMEQSADEQGRSKLLNEYIDKLVETSEFDVPDALVLRQADSLLHRSESELSRYGITLEQYLQYKGQTHEQAVEELRPQAERDVLISLALREVSNAEGLSVDDAEVDAEIERMVNDVKEEQRELYRNAFKQDQMRSRMASAALDRKLRDRLVAIATGDESAGDPAAQDAQRAVNQAQESGEESSAEEAVPAGESATGKRKKKGE